MTTTIRSAAKGQRKAMQSLYEANKKQVYFVAKSLLMDTKQANSITVAVFKEAWQHIRSSKVNTEKEFSEYVLLKAIGLCKAKAHQKNPKAFRIPHNKNFLLPVNLYVKDDFADELAYLMANLPVMHRYIFVLHCVCGFDALQIGRIMKCPSEMIVSAIEAEAINFERLQKLSAKKYGLTYDEIVQDITASEESLAVPASMEEQIAAAIDAIATPAEEQEKKIKYTVSVVTVLLCACLLIAALIVFLPGDSDNSGQDGTSTSSTDDTAVTDDLGATEGTTSAEDETSEETEGTETDAATGTDETGTVEDASSETTSDTGAETGDSITG